MDFPRRFYDLTAAVRSLQSQLDTLQNTVLNRMGTHTHKVTVPSYTSSTRPASPSTGDLIYETDTELFAYYNGSAWVEYISAGDATTVHEAEYTATSGQVIATGTDTPLAFPTASYSTADVTVGTSTSGSIANAKFTLNRGGLWQIDAGCRTGAATSGKSYGIWLGPDGGTSRYAGSFTSAGGTDAQEFAISATRRYLGAATVNVNFWHDQGTSHTTGPLAGSNYLRLNWLRS